MKFRRGNTRVAKRSTSVSMRDTRDPRRRITAKDDHQCRKCQGTIPAGTAAIYHAHFEAVEHIWCPKENL